MTTEQLLGRGSWRMRIRNIAAIAFFDSLQLHRDKSTLHKAGRAHQLAHGLSALFSQMMRQPLDFVNISINMLQIDFPDRGPSVAVPEKMCGVALGLMALVAVASL